MNGSFWQRVFFGPDCLPQYIHHIIVPTIFFTRVASWKTILRFANKEHPAWEEVQRRNCSCCFCDTELFEEKAVLAVRVLLSKRPCKKIPNTTSILVSDRPFSSVAESFLYQWAFGSASICGKCADTRKLRALFDSNSDMQEEMFSRLEQISAHINSQLERASPYNNVGPDLNPSALLQQILDTFEGQAHRVAFMRSLGKIDNPSCMHCTNPSKRRCNNCHFARYCGLDCCVADWERHKPECTILVTSPFFYGGKKNVEK